MLTADQAYADISLATDYCTQRGFSAWANASDDSRRAALIRASDWLDQHFHFRGTPLAPDQLRAWPRQDVELSQAAADAGAVSDISDAKIPDRIIHATIELAVALLSSEREAEVLLGLSGAVSQERVGSLSIAYDTKGRSGQGRILSLIRPYLRADSHLTVRRS